MPVGRREQKKERQPGTSADEGMHSIAQQERAGMVSGCVAKGGILVTAAPSQNGSTVNDQITSPNESRAESVQNGEYKERLMQRGTSCVATFALLGFARNAGLPLSVQGQPTSQSERWPTLEPIMHILIRQAPQGT
jgi:hypothetical protein